MLKNGDQTQKNLETEQVESPKENYHSRVPFCKKKALLIV